MKFAVPIFEIGNLKFRLLEISDLKMTLNWRNQKDIRSWFIHSDKISWKEHLIWFKKYIKKNNDYIFIIEETSTINKPVGQISLYDIDWINKRCELGRLMIGEKEARGKGLAKKATMFLTEMAFNFFLMDELYLNVFKNNLPAIHIYKKCGFKKIEDKDNIFHMRLLKNDRK